jgi:hypothetical protein
MSFTLVLDTFAPDIRLQAGGEEILHLEHALRRFHVFAGNRAAHRGFMHAHHFRHLHHRQRLQMRDPFVHELALPLHDFARDVADGALALMQDS